MLCRSFKKSSSSFKKLKMATKTTTKSKFAILLIFYYISLLRFVSIVVLNKETEKKVEVEVRKT